MYAGAVYILVDRYDAGYCTVGYCYAVVWGLN